MEFLNKVFEQRDKPISDCHTNRPPRSQRKRWTSRHPQYFFCEPRWRQQQQRWEAVLRRQFVLTSELARTEGPLSREIR